MSRLEQVADWARGAARRTPGRLTSQGGAELPPPPTFLIVGAQKGGTRWLRHNLGRHPDVFASGELHFFNDTRRYRRGFEWYRAQFAGWSGEPALGESTPGYSMPLQRPERAAARIEADLPGVRLLAVLRDPCERALSALVHHVDRGRMDRSTDLLEYVSAHDPPEEPLQLVSGGRYAENLRPYLERFGDRLRVFLNEDLRDDPVAVYRAALDHIGVDPDFVPEKLDKVRYSNADAKSRYRAGGRVLTPDERRALLPYFLDDIERLEEMIGRDLSAWRAVA